MCDAEIGWRDGGSRKLVKKPLSESIGFDSSSDILLNTGIRYIADQNLGIYSLNKDDLENKTIKEVSKDIKIQKKIDDGFQIFISDEHNSYSNLKSDFLPINQEDKISVLVHNSNQKPTINFIHDMRDWMNKKDEESKNNNEEIKKLKNDNKIILERLERIEKSSYFKILIRQLRKLMKENIFVDLSRIYTEMNGNDLRDNCEFVLNKIKQDSNSILLHLRGWSRGELLLLFDEQLNIELNNAAHPKFKDQINLEDLKEACDSMGDHEDLKKLHNKIYEKLYGNAPSSSNAANLSKKKRSGNKKDSFACAINLNNYV